MTRPTETFIGQPVRSLQTMLRVISQIVESQPSLVPDGIYGVQTMGAVSAFQRDHGLPVTGVTDLTTWEAIVAEYEQAIVQVGPAQPLGLTLEPGQVITMDQRDPNIYVLQAVLTVMSKATPSITPPGFTGVLDEATAHSLATFQALAGLPESGHLDKVTWKHLAVHYPMAAGRVNGTQNGTAQTEITRTDVKI